jgi:hypothetical protein
MHNIRIECTWYKSKRDFNKFIKSLGDSKPLIVDYTIIYNKLLKADPYRDEPHESIVGLNIINTISKALDEEREVVPEIIVYSFKNLNAETVLNFRGLIESHTSREYSLALNVLNMPKAPKKEVLSKFDCVKFIDND